MPLPIASRAPAALSAGLGLGLAVCAGLVVHARYGAPPSPAPARAANATPGPGGVERGDVDGDGAADCWSVSRHDDFGFDLIKLVVRRSCAEPALELSTPIGAMVVLEVPPPYRTAPWLALARWLAVVPRDLVERIQTVRCEAGRVIVEQASALDELSDGRAQLPLRDSLRHQVHIELARGWWRIGAVD